MRGEKSGKASLCCSVFPWSNGTVTAIYGGGEQAEVRGQADGRGEGGTRPDQRLGGGRQQSPQTPPSPQTQTGNPSRMKLSENILSNIRHDLDQSTESLDTMGRQAAGRKESGRIVCHPHRIGYFSSVSSEIQQQTNYLAGSCVSRTE